jgi:hypothetical protein
MRSIGLRLAVALLIAAFTQSFASGQVVLIAKGTLTASSAGDNKDLSGLDYRLENGVNADLLGGLGSGLTYVSGNTFLAIPDRGPNAVPFNSAVDDTASYIARFHTVHMNLQPNSGAGLPFTLAPELVSTTLLSSPSPLVYGSGLGLGLGSGVTPLNRPSRNYFTGRSDNFDPSQNSGDPKDARLDPEGIRVSNNGVFVFISDEYGPYVYQFNRLTGQRVRSFVLPQSFYVATPHPTGAAEIAGNPSGRTSNKGMEGLAITPDGKTLVGIIQAAFVEDALAGAAAGRLLRIVTIDIDSGETTHQYAYLLTTGSGVSEITALNDHEFLVDERDGKGLGDGSKAKIKQIFKIDLNGAFDVTGLSGAEAATHGVSKSLFLDIVQVLKANGIADTQIPAKLEGITLGPDVVLNNKNTHTLWVANDNDFLPDFSGPGSNPNQYFVFGFTDSDLGSSSYVPQNVKSPFDR